MFADYHVHTEFSDDSVYPMEDVVRMPSGWEWMRSVLPITWTMA